MYEKEKGLVDAFMRGQMSRRSMIRGLGSLGVTAATAGVLVNLASTQALAGEFDWKKHSGTTVKLLLNKHPYTDAMIADLDNFKQLTGMDVKYDVFPEDVYFDKVTAALSSGSSEYDAFMTGAYMTWTYGPAGWIEDLNEWIQDANKTNPLYAWEDMLPGVRKSCAWNGVPGDKLGSADAKQWCIPWGYEQNNITYNKRIFDANGLNVPTNLDELLEVGVKAKSVMGGGYGIGVRGSRSWATIHPGFLSGYANFDQKDLNVGADGKLTAAMNTKVSKEYHAKWVKMIQDSGAPDWSNDTWYQVGTDLGAGKSALIFDADILGYFMNGPGNAEAGNQGIADYISETYGVPSTIIAYGGEHALGEHKAIIDRAVWDKVHAILKESPRKRAARTRADTPALLKGLLYGPDGAAFSPTHTRKGGKLYRLYVSQSVLKHGAGSCPVGRVPAGDIEAAVIDQLRAVFRQPEIVAGTWKVARSQDDEITDADAREPSRTLLRIRSARLQKARYSRKHAHEEPSTLPSSRPPCSTRSGAHRGEGKGPGDESAWFCVSGKDSPSISGLSQSFGC